MNQLGVTIVWCALQVTVLALVACLIYLLVGRLSAGARTIVPFAALAMIVALTLLAFVPIPSWLNTLDADSFTSHVRDETARAATAGLEPDGQAGADDNTTLAASSNQESSLVVFGRVFLQELSSPTSLEPSSQPRWRWSGIVACCFLVVASLGMIQLVSGLLSLSSYRRRSRLIEDSKILETLDVLRAELRCRRIVELREAPNMSTAATAGSWRPMILLPPEWRGWTTQEQRAVLAHELAHICRGDFVANAFAQLGLAIHFYNPLVHWIVGRIRLEQELAADALAASVSGGEKSYLQILAAMALRQPERTVGWPARGFLPTRTMFLRRIEMLRHVRVSEPRRRSNGWRLAAVGLLAAMSLVIAGVRGPATIGPDAAAAQEPNAAADAANAEFDWRYVSDEAGIVLAVKPADILARPDMAEVVLAFEEMDISKQAIGLASTDLESIVVTFGVDDEFDCLVLTAKKTVDVTESKFGQLLKIGEEKKYKEQSYVTGALEGKAIWQPNDRSLVIDKEANIRRYIAGHRAPQRLVGSKIPAGLKEAQVIVAVSRDRLQALRRPEKGPAPIPAPLDSLIAPLLEATQSVHLGCTFAEGISVDVVAQCKSEQSASDVKATLEALAVLAKNWIEQSQKQIDRMPAGQQRRFAESLTSAGIGYLNNLEVASDGATVELKTDGNIEALRLGVLLPSLQAARAAARRTQSMNNLKQIALGFHNFHDTYKRLPNSRNLADKSQQPGSSDHPHSWRVALLPFLGHADLYGMYHFDEPWDSEHNKTLLGKMPVIYRHPDEPADSTNSCYFAITGPETIFTREKISFATITDGTSNTILAVEAKRRIPWTKPEDLPYAADKELPKLGGFHAEGYNAALCDGSVRFIAKAINKQVLRALMTARGGEVVRVP